MATGLTGQQFAALKLAAELKWRDRKKRFPSRTEMAEKMPKADGKIGMYPSTLQQHLMALVAKGELVKLETGQGFDFPGDSEFYPPARRRQKSS